MFTVLAVGLMVVAALVFLFALLERVLRGLEQDEDEQ